MRVAMQVLMALTASLLVLSVIVHLSGTADAIAQGLHTAPSSVSLHANAIEALAANGPADPSASKVLQHVYATLGEDVQERDRSNGDVTLEIAYEGKTVEDGGYVPMRKASSAPTIVVSDAKSDDRVYYTWILIDIDAPKPADPSHAPFLHYIVANLDPLDTQSPHVVVSYYPVSPPVGEHRYIGLLFAQSNGRADESSLSAYEAKLSSNRVLFDVKKYADREALAYVQRSYFYSQPVHQTTST